MDQLGDKASQLVQGAEREVILVAPYIKAGALNHLLSSLGNHVDDLTCVTRWLPEDIAAGVCDLEILDMIEDRGGSLHVHPHLHAKYYRVDGQCLVGSANLTGRAMGWRTPANIELLVELPFDFAGVREWEGKLLSAAIKATPELRDQIKEEAAQLRTRQQFSTIPEVGDEQETADVGDIWVPRCPIPDYLWVVYSGVESGGMLQSTLDAANRDLESLQPPKGLSQPLFYAYISGIVKQMPLMLAIDELASNGLSDSEAYVFLENHLGGNAPYSPQETWGVLKTWLVHFLGSSYRVETREDVLVKGQRIVNPEP